MIGQRAGHERHDTFRDLVARSARDFARTAADAFRGRQIVAGDKIDEFWALKDIDFEIRWGEVVGIIGRNGAGKSTLLKVLSRITEPTQGRVVIGGRVASLLEVGTGFHPELTGRENIYLNGAILGMSRAEIRRKFDEIVAFAEVEKFLDTPVKRYSSGMYVRLAFAVAAHLEPEILIVDEVLAVGDVEFQNKCLGKMSEVATGGRTVLFVSHNLGAVGTLCERCILLAEGRIFKDGRSSEVVAEYLAPRRNGQMFGARGLAEKPAALVAAAIVGEGAHNNCVYWSNNFLLQIDYRAANLPGLELSFILSDGHGRKVFYSTEKRPYDDDLGPHYRAIVKIPGRFLAPGSYSVMASLHNPNVEIYDCIADLVTFNVIANNPDHYRFGASDIGVVTVDLDWTVEKREEPLLDA